MNPMLQLRTHLLATLFAGAVITTPAIAQENAPETPAITADNAEPQWKQLADQILKNYGDESIHGRNLSETQRAIYKTVIDLYTELNKLPKDQTLKAHRYMMAKSSNPELIYGEVINSMYEETTVENARFVRPYFDKFSDEQKLKFLSPLIVDAVLLQPEVPEFREFPDSVLQQAAQGATPSRDLVSQAATIIPTGLESELAATNMKPFRTHLLAALFAGAVITTPAIAQENAPETPAITADNAEPQWKQLADQKIELYEKESSLNDVEKFKNFDAIQDISNQMSHLPKEQRAKASRYVMSKSSDPQLIYGEAFSLMYTDTAVDKVRFIRPYFDKLPTSLKLDFLSGQVVDAVLLQPEVPEFREFPDSVLQPAAQGATPSRDLVSQAATIVVNGITPQEEQWLHQALTHYPESSGLWNALTQLNALTPAEVGQARQLFAAKQGQSGWRLTLAAALSPYDPKMRAIVRQTVEAEFKAKSDTQDYAPVLMALRFWQLDQALPYIFRLLHSKNEKMRVTALPLLAMRAPQEVLRIARQAGAKQKFSHLDAGLALVTLLHPQFQPQVPALLARLDGIVAAPSESQQQAEEEHFSQVLEELRLSGMTIFSEYDYPNGSGE